MKQILRGTGKVLLPVIILIGILLPSCKNQRLAIPEYIEYVRSSQHGLMNTIHKNGFQFTSLYESADYLTLKELRNVKVTKENFESTRTKFVDYLYFDFSIKTEPDKKILDPTDSSGFERKYNYFSFEISKDIFLLYKTDTLSCLMHQFTSGNGITPEYHLELMFERPSSTLSSSDSLYFIYKDQILNTGNVQIPTLVKDIENTPQLKI